MNRRTKSCIAAAVLALVSVAAQADGDAARGAKLAYTCLGCHGIENYKNAYPKYSVPKLGGQNPAYIVAALAEYKAGARWHPTMRGFATELSDQDRADLAAYFNAGDAEGSSAEPVGTPPEQAATCVACHGKNGVGTMTEYPNLARPARRLHRPGAERLPPRQAQEPDHAAVRAAALAGRHQGAREILLRAEGPRDPEARLRRPGAA